MPMSSDTNPKSLAESTAISGSVDVTSSIPASPWVASVGCIALHTETLLRSKSVISTHAWAFSGQGGLSPSQRRMHLFDELSEVESGEPPLASKDSEMQA